MSSLTSVISMLRVMVKDARKEQKMTIPLDCSTEDLVRRLNCCMDRFAFDEWHHIRLDWVNKETKSRKLAHLCREVASSLQHAVLKAELLRYHTRRKTPLPSCFWSSRHLVVSALGDILSAFNAFRAVSREPDLNTVPISSMIRVYLKETFHLMFLFGKLASSKDFFRWWKELLAESNFEDFRFDNEAEYARLNRPLMDNTSITGVLEDPARMPGSCLPFYPCSQTLYLETGPYGSATLRNLPGPL